MRVSVKKAIPTEGTSMRAMALICLPCGGGGSPMTSAPTPLKGEDCSLNPAFLPAFFFFNFFLFDNFLCAQLEYHKNFVIYIYIYI
jgi:hypothetical protein